jgi:hypothetical protein
MQCELNRSISTVWEEVRDLSGYSDRKISNIHKENEDTWYFTFYFEKRRFSRIMSPTISGRAYSKDDSLTKIEMKSGSYLATFFTLTACILFIFVNSFISGIFSNMVIKVLLMTCIVFAFIFIHNKESKSNIDEFVKKLHIEDNMMGKRNFSRMK